MTDLLTTSTHEAGHAVVATALGVGVRSVTIIGDPGRSGHIDLDGAAPLADHLVVRLGGRAACDAFGVDSAGCSIDMHDAQLFAREIALDATAEGVRACEVVEAADRLARRIVFNFGRAVGEVSIALLQRMTLSGADVLAVMAGAPPFDAGMRVEHLAVTV